MWWKVRTMKMERRPPREAVQKECRRTSGRGRLPPPPARTQALFFKTTVVTQSVPAGRLLCAEPTRMGGAVPGRGGVHSCAPDRWSS